MPKTLPKTSAPTQLVTPAAAKSARLQMADVAKLAGVSASTVSRALSGSTLVNEATRTRVRELAASLNYSINVGAQNLRRKQNRTIAVVLPFDFRSPQTASDPFFIGLLGSIADALTSRGYEMLLSRIDAEQLINAMQLVHTGRAAGIVLIGQWHQHAQLNHMAERGVPMVVWGARMPDQLYCSVGSDNEAGGRLAAQHLIKQGRKRIAFLGDTSWPEVAQRFAGYRDAHDKAKLPLDPELSLPASFVSESGRHAIEYLIKRGVVFDAVFACSDLLAMTAIQTLQAHGRTVPSDVAVVGYDDVALATYFQPAISTIAQPMHQAGDALATALFNVIEGKQPTSQFLRTELVARASSFCSLDLKI
jgi:DNA-binding LacI/PurR family transcriptional regulator